MIQKNKSTEETAISPAPLNNSIPSKEKKMNCKNNNTKGAASATKQWPSFFAMRGTNGLPKASKGQLPRCFWHVTETGNYLQDERTGHVLALEYLAFQSSDNMCPMLPNIISDMAGRTGPIEIAFLTLIEFAATTPSGTAEANRIGRYWEKCAAERELEAQS